MTSSSPESEFFSSSDVDIEGLDSTTGLEFLPLGSTPTMLVTTSRRHEQEPISDADGVQYYDKEALDSLLKSITNHVPESQERSEIVSLPWPKRRRVLHTRMQSLKDMLAQIERVTTILQRSVAAEMKVLEQALLRDCTTEVSDETLLAIFRFAGECGRNWRTTLRLSHTCARWRRLVVKAPSLWSSMEWTMTTRSRPPLAIKKLFLDRSIPALISLHLTCNLETQEIQDNCGIPMSRLSSLVIEYSHTSCIEKSAWLHDNPAPALQELMLRNRHFFISSFWTKLAERWSGSSHVLTQPFFSNQTHQLRSLYLRGCRLPWTAGSYVGLTSIAISLGAVEHADSERDVDPSTYDILHIFRNCPGLERFSLDCPDAVPVGKLGPGDVRIPMRHLTHLDLTLSSEIITTILSSLATLPTLRLRLGCVFMRSALGRCIQLPLDRCLPCLGTITSLKLDVSGGKIVAHTGKESQRDDCDAVLQANVVTSAPSGRSPPSDPSTAEKVLASTFSYFSNQSGTVFPLLYELSLLDTVSLEVPDKKKLIEESDLALFLWHHPGIRNLTLFECSQSLFVNMGEHQANEVTPYCPNLEIIELRQMRLESRKLFQACKLLCRAGRTLRLSELTLVADKSADEALKDQTAKAQRKARVKALKDVLHQIRDMGFANVICVRIREASDGVLLKWDS